MRRRRSWPSPRRRRPAQNVAADDKAAEAKAEEAKAEETTAQAQPAATGATASAPAAEPSGAGAASPDRNSATAEMLAMATKDAAGPRARRGDAAPAAATRRRRLPGRAAARRTWGPARGMGPANMGPNAAGPGGMNPSQMQAGMQEQMQVQMQQQGSRCRQHAGWHGPGRPGAGWPAGRPRHGGECATPSPPISGLPKGAVQAFLDALKDRDLGRLTEATALRAQNEAVKHNQEMFKRIFDGSFSKAEIDDLAAKLDGYKIMQLQPAQEQRPPGRDRLQARQQRQHGRRSRSPPARRRKAGASATSAGRPS